MKRIGMALLILSILMVAVGCSQQGGPTTGADPYLGGDTGIEAEFEPFGVRNDQSKLYEIFEGETFPIEVTLNNEGEFQVEPGMVKISLKGINIGDFANVAGAGILSNTQAIEAKDETNTEGGEDTLDFTPQTTDAEYLIPLSGSTLDLSVFAEVVYEYKTFTIVPEICYKEDLKDERICEAEGVKTSYSSSAPIQVTKAEQKLAGKGRIAVEFDIEDKQHDNTFTTVTKPDTDFDSRFDMLSFTVEPSDDWECKSNGKLNEARLDENGKATVRCVLRQPMSEGTLYTRQLDLTLHYKYRTLIKEVVRIKSE